MKKKSLLLVLCAFYACIAYGFEEGGIYYNVTSSSEMTVRVVKGSEKYEGICYIPEYVIHEGETYYVTGISSNAFSGCTELISVTFDSNSCVSSIGGSAFSGCNGMGSITIPASVTSIGDYAFSGCKTLRTVIIEDSETTLSLGRGSMKGSDYPLFADCPLTTFYWGRPLSYNTNYGFSPISNQILLKNIGIGPNVTTISAYMFSGHTESSIELPETVTALGDHAFDGFTELTSFTIPKHITSIGKYAFANCTGLTSFTIPTWISTINAGTFSGCTGLTSIVIPNTVTTIGNGAFNGCTAITGVVFEEGEKTLALGYNTYTVNSEGGRGMFYDCPLQSAFIGRPLNYETGKSSGYSPFALNETITKAHFGNPVKTIQSYLLYGCLSLNTLEYNTSCAPTSVESYAFCGCKSLTWEALSLPQSVETIENGAFKDCVKITSIVIEPNVKSIGSFVFNGCTAMTGVVFEESEKTLALGYNTYTVNNEGGKGMFYDCPLQSAFIGRPLNYETGKSSGYSPFALNETITKAHFGNPVKTIQSYLLYGCLSLNTLEYNTNCAPTSVESYAFCGCKSLTWEALSLPQSVETIENGAFKDCVKITSIVIEPNVKSIGSFVFNGCTAMTGVVFEESEKTLSLGYNTYNAGGEGRGMFYDCPLQSAFIGRPLNYDTSKSSGYSPFAESETMTKAHFGNPVKTIQSYLLYGCLSLNTLEYNTSCAPTSVESYAFCGCKSLTWEALSLPQSVETIENGAFKDCVKITSIVIKPNVKSIGSFVFNGCTAMTGVVFEESEKTLSLGYNTYNAGGEGRGMFYDCPLQSAFIGRPLNYDTGKSSGYSPFALSETMTKAHFGNPVKAIPNYLLYSVKNLSTIIYNEKCQLESIGKYAFDGCKKLPTQKFHNTITAFGEGAFRNCILFTDFDLPEKLATIGSYAFQNCTGLTKLTIPATVTSIGNYAYDGCNGITSVTVKWTKPISIYSETFSNRTNAVLEVPHGSVAAYKAANYWKEFKVIIEAGEDPISVLKGDMDGDGVLDVNDVQMLINVILGRK